MFLKASLLRRQSGWHRKLVLAVLFALQGAITFAPLLEASERGRMGAHAEEQGARHKYQHNEATCAVCAVRSLHAAPVQNCAAIACERQRSVTVLDAPRAPALRVISSALPRAPPQLS
jgi:hypothetical protein